MANFLGGENSAGDKLKTLDLWYGPGTPATNEIEFSAKPGGDRIIQGNGSFGSLTNMGNWWTLTESGSEVLIKLTAARLFQTSTASQVTLPKTIREINLC